MEFFKIRRTVPFMRHAKVFNIISEVTFILAVGLLATKGLHFSIEFLGGTVMEVTYKDEAKPDAIRQALNNIGHTDISVTKFGTSHDVLIRLPLKVKEGLNQNEEMKKQADERDRLTERVNEFDLGVRQRHEHGDDAVLR